MIATQSLKDLWEEHASDDRCCTHPKPGDLLLHRLYWGAGPGGGHTDYCVFVVSAHDDAHMKAIIMWHLLSTDGIVQLSRNTNTCKLPFDSAGQEFTWYYLVES